MGSGYSLGKTELESQLTLNEGIPETERPMKIIHAIQRDFPDLASLARSATREMVNARTVELAALAGRKSHEINQRDYIQAMRELTGETDFERQQAILDTDESLTIMV